MYGDLTGRGEDFVGGRLEDREVIVEGMFSGGDVMGRWYRGDGWSLGVWRRR